MFHNMIGEVVVRICLVCRDDDDGVDNDEKRERFIELCSYQNEALRNDNIALFNMFNWHFVSDLILVC